MPEGRRQMGAKPPVKDITEDLVERLVALDKHIKEMRAERAAIVEQLLLMEERLRALQLIREMENERCPKR